MKRRLTIRQTLLTAITALSMIPFYACGDTPTLKAPSGSDSYKGQNYQYVINELENAGFTIAETVVLDDLTSDSGKADGSVESVSINNDDFFVAEDSFPINAQAVVTYHIIPKRAIPISSSNAGLEDPFDLEAAFEDAGFTNVTLSETYDMDPDQMTADFTKEVSVARSTKYQQGDEAAFDAPVNIVCHYPYDKYNVHVNVDFLSNWIFSKYDVVLKVNDSNQFRMAHGTDGSFDMRLESGDYILKFVKADAASPTGEAPLTVDSDVDAAYQISCHSDRIDVREQYAEHSDAIAEDTLKISASPYAFHRQDYQSLVQSLEDLGFTNIEEEPLYDLEDDRIPEGAVELVSINGKSDYKRGDVFQKDAEVVVSYHLSCAAAPTEAPETTTATTPTTTKPATTSDTTATTKSTTTSDTTTSTSIASSISVTDTTITAETETTDSSFTADTVETTSISSGSNETSTETGSIDRAMPEESETESTALPVSDTTTVLSETETTTQTPETTQTTTTTTTTTTKATTTTRRTTVTTRAATTTTKVKNDYELGISYPRPTGTLKKGNSGKEVGWLQTALNKVMKSGLTVNSNFDKDTDAAVRSFQTRCSLGTDGIAGPKTINKLVAILSGAETLPAETQPPTTRATTKPPVTQPRVTTAQPQPVYTQAKTKPVFVGEPTYIINTNSGKIHKPNCPSVSKMSKSNRKEWYGTLQEALDSNSRYSTCNNCLK